jgi:hypothetical protein
MRRRKVLENNDNSRVGDVEMLGLFNDTLTSACVT